MSFGVITACYRGDYFMVKATCASIRHFMPDVPICVIVDGDFSIGELERLYRVRTLYIKDFQNATLRKLCPGSPRSKLAALWESPFDRFLCVDSDIVVWGDLSLLIDLNKNDFVVLTNQCSRVEDKENISYYFLNPDRIGGLDPDFKWIGQPFFCAGAFAARKNCLDLQEYVELEDYALRTPGVFNFAEQGIFNYMVLRDTDRGTIKTAVADLQYIVVDHPLTQAKERFRCDGWMPPKKVATPTLIHFCGQKPLIQNVRAFSEPFTSFRLAHYRRVYGNGLKGRVCAWLRVLQEEAQVARPRIKRRIKRFISASSGVSKPEAT